MEWLSWWSWLQVCHEVPAKLVAGAVDPGALVACRWCQGPTYLLTDGAGGAAAARPVHPQDTGGLWHSGAVGQQGFLCPGSSEEGGPWETVTGGA